MNYGAANALLRAGDLKLRTGGRSRGAGGQPFVVVSQRT